jgi:hypothetical protein
MVKSMKRLSVLAIISAMAIIGIITSISRHQIYAPRDCGQCSEFKKLTNEFEKDVKNAAIGDPGIIPSLVDTYSDNVKELFREPSTSP